jgi:hypothetical protein
MLLASRALELETRTSVRVHLAAFPGITNIALFTNLKTEIADRALPIQVELALPLCADKRYSPVLNP